MEKQEATRKKITEALTSIGITEVEPLIDEFKLLSAQEEGEPLREIARLVNERIDSYAKMLEDFLQPDTHIASMNEVGFFTEQELADIINLYRAMMRLFRHFTRATLISSTEAHTTYITTALKDWAGWKPSLLKLVEKLERGWESGQPLHTEGSYFG